MLLQISTVGAGERELGQNRGEYVEGSSPDMVVNSVCLYTQY